MSLKTILGDTCSLCATLAIGSLILQAVTWAMILVSN